MKPPADCKELARRLVADAAPLHGRTYHDMRLAAAIIGYIGEELPSSSRYWLEVVFSQNSTLYHVEPEDNR